MSSMTPAADVERSTQLKWGTCDDGYEFYRFVQHQWNVDEAKNILATEPHKIEHVRAEDVKKRIQPPPEVDAGMQIIHTAVDWEHARSDEVDHTFPLIMAWITEMKGTENEEPVEPQPIIIDGYHRAAKAIDEGVEEIPAILLTQEENEKIHTNLME